MFWLIADAVALCFVLVSFVVVLAAGLPTIALLKRLSFRQKAYEDAPKTHAVKTGTPTMGGVLFVVGLVPITLLAIGANVTSASTMFGPLYVSPEGIATANVTLAVLFLGFGCAAIGFADDLMGVLRGRNRGLGAREKFALTAIVAIAFLLWFGKNAPEMTRMLSFGSFSFGIPWWAWFALSLIAILSTTHAVNLTDGLDGLASGTILAPLALLAYIGSPAVRQLPNPIGLTSALTTYVALSLIGSVLGFLVYNRHPAKVFMGDTGSLLLGGMLAGCAIALDQQLLLPIIGGVFVAEALSVIMQVTYFKRTGKRIFKMSPLHHHFELAGWPETKVTARFWLASLVLSAIGFATMFLPAAAV